MIINFPCLFKRGQTLDELTYSGMCSVGKELSRFSAEYCKQLWEVLLTILQPRASMREKKDIGNSRGLGFGSIRNY